MTPEMLEDPFKAKYDLRLKIGAAMLFPERCDYELEECFTGLSELNAYMKMYYTEEELTKVNNLLDIKCAAELRWINIAGGEVVSSKPADMIAFSEAA